MAKPVHISAPEARRIALTAQGLGKARPAKPTRAHVERQIAQLGALQIDAVNVLARAHYMPLYARLGAYPTSALDAAWLGPKRTCFEYWGHQASILPYTLLPLMRWRMERARAGLPLYGGGVKWTAQLKAYAKANKRYHDAILAEIKTRGALTARELSDAGKRQGPWWGWSEGKRAAEHLFRTGELAVGARRGFERVYDLPERVHPKAALDAPTPKLEDTIRELTRHALGALGVADESDLANYFMVQRPDVRRAMAELVEEGVALPAQLEGWERQSFVHAEARAPRKLEAAALISPFDSLMWRRERVSRLFGLDYKIGIYTPQAERTHGYYVLPFLHGETFAAQLDLKADRAAGALLVQAAHREGEAPAKPLIEALRTELLTLRDWLGLTRIKVAKRGDLAPALAKAL
jgi:uncharacterized protein YcaQ